MTRPLPPHARAVRDQLAATLRDAAEPLDLNQLHQRAPTVQRHLRRDGAGLCIDDHAALTAHPAITLRHCLGSAGHVVDWRIAPVELHGHLGALLADGYLELHAADPAAGLPSRWSWIPAEDADTPARRHERRDRMTFAAIAFAAGHTGAVR